jgi:hypothetical protein
MAQGEGEPYRSQFLPNALEGAVQGGKQGLGQVGSQAEQHLRHLRHHGALDERAVLREGREHGFA